MQRRLVVQRDVVERVAQDFRGPGPCRQRTLLHPELAHTQQEPRHTQGQPGDAQVVHKSRSAHRGLDQPTERRLPPQQQRDQSPSRHQHDFAADVVADLDGFLVRVAGLVDIVVTTRLEEKVASLAQRHRHAPGQDRRQGRID